MATLYKIKYKGYICDLYLPDISQKRIVVLVPGLPKSSNVEKLVDVFLKSGCTVIYPNFSGTYDSSGKFDGLQSIQDIHEFLNCTKQKQVTELYYGKKIKIQSSNGVVLAGMSFGALPCLLSSKKDIDKLMLLSPALLLNQKEIEKIIKLNFKEKMEFLLNLLKNAFPYTYRIKSIKNLQKFLFGQINFLSRKNIEETLNEIKIPTLVIHGTQDASIPYNITESLQKSVNNKAITWFFPSVGHSNSSYDKATLDKIHKFLLK